MNGSFIVNEGDPASSFYIIMEGNVSVLKSKQLIRKLSAGESFGEQALYDVSAKRLMSIQACGDVKVLALGREQLREILGDQVQMIIVQNLSRWAIQRHQTIQKFTKIQQERILNHLQQKELPTGEIIPHEDYSIFILISGDVIDSITNTKPLAKGEGLLLLPNYDLPMIKGQLRLLSDGIISFLPMNKLEEILRCSVENAIKKSSNSHENRLMSFISDIKLHNPIVNPTNLHVLKCLGYGHFGRVYLVHCPVTKCNYALKAIKKKAIREERVERHVKSERLVMEKISFPFCVTHVKSMEDSQRIFFLMEFIPGMELFDAIREIGLLNSEEAKFYVSILVLVLEYLHTCNVVYRDLKPENIMVDSNVKLSSKKRVFSRLSTWVQRRSSLPTAAPSQPWALRITSLLKSSREKDILTP